jgi:CheY-like chemotaxis protein
MNNITPLQITLLIVDDQPVNIKALSNLLKDDYEIMVATSGEAALEIVTGNEKPDLILLDIQMPGMDGYEVCKRLKSDNRTSDIPIIFITAKTSPEDEETGLSLGAADYITKPFQPQVVRARVRNQIVQKISENALKNANYKLNLLSSITRHDILNRAMVISFYSEIIMEETTDPVLRKKIQAIIQSSGEIKNLIGFTGEYQNLGESLPRWHRIEFLFKKKSIQGLLSGLELILDLHGVEIYADNMLEKVIYNLVENSVRHGINLTQIRLSYKDENGTLTLLYEDDGGGIPDDQKELSFERGYGKNTGLGLFLIREILSITGISIRETGQEGNGVRFEIIVPFGEYRFAQESN